ncbi:MAG: restriction endonuclease [Luteimonas sp.]
MSILLAIASVLAIGFAATAYLRQFRRRQAEMTAGLSALAAMRWRDFAALAQRMLRERGYTNIEQHPLGNSDQAYFVMQRVGERCIVACKHGTAIHLGARDLKDLGESIRLHDAASGKVITAGQFAADAQPEANRQRIELIDGATLWPEVAPLLPEAQLQHIRSVALDRSKREIMIAWVFAAVVGLAIGLLLPREADDVAPGVAVPVVQPSASTPLPTAATRVPSAPAPKTIVAMQPQQTDVEQRQDALRAIGSLPDIERALWSTQSTVSVFLLSEKQQPWADICKVLSRYPAVRSVRVQLTPPTGSTSPVRFRQCFAY